MDTTPRCCARIGEYMPEWAPRKGDRCGSASSIDLPVGGDVYLPLCQVHMRKLLASSDSAALARSWSPDAAARD